jgi:Tol biopolymer transport system component
MTLIAFVDPDGRVQLTSSSSGLTRPITPAGMRFTWPTWSPDGNFLTVSRYSAGENGHGGFRICLTDPTGESLTEIYANMPGTDAIAQETPHYAMWSPDSENVAFVAQMPGEGLTLFVRGSITGGEPKQLLSGGPVFASWSPDSKFLLVHSGQLHYLIRSDDLEPAQIPVVSSQYMSPSWSPLSNSMAFCGELSEHEQGLLVADTDGDGAKMISEVSGSATFSWHPAGRHIGLAKDLDRASGFYNSLWMVDTEKETEEQILNDRFLSFFWSPDGAFVAYVSPSAEGDGSIRWAILNVNTKESYYLADFQPTREQLNIFMFFDQYGQSHSPWSHDSRSLIFAGQQGAKAVRSRLPETRSSQVCTISIARESRSSVVGSGAMGVWCPVPEQPEV